MKTVFKANRADPNRRIGFVDLPGYERSVHLYPSKDEDAETLLGLVEVMICRVLRSEDGKIRCAFVRREKPTDLRVVFDGFEISGSECSTSTRYWILKPDERWGTAEEAVRHYRSVRRSADGTAYPGMLHGDVITADNVNPPRTEIPTPGFGWLEEYVRDGRRQLRLAGVDSFERILLGERAPV